METTNHDNVNVKVNSRITIYGGITVIGGVSLVSLLFLFLAIFMITHWQQTILLSAILVYGGITLVASVALIGVTWLAFKLAGSAYIEFRQRKMESDAQSMRNMFIHAQETSITFVRDGHIEVMPLFPTTQMIEAPKLESTASKETVMELYDAGRGLRDIATDLDMTFYQVQKITSAETKKREKAKKD